MLTSPSFSCFRNLICRAYASLVEDFLKAPDSIDWKYGDFRNDIAEQDQHFTSMSCKRTEEVVSLFPKVAVETAASSGKKKAWRKKRDAANNDYEQQQNVLNDDKNVASPPVDIGSINTIVNAAENLALQEEEELIPALHLSPEEWHTKLLEVAAANSKDDNSSSSSGALLIDTRNDYESKVGQFDVDGIAKVLSKTRKFSDMPQVFLDNKERIAGKEVFMYCTGGVRCEMASAHLRSITSNWDERDRPTAIYQLKGGIHRYLETYGRLNEAADESCLFKGKNFVFDQRRTDPRVGREKLGSCHACNKPHDDFDNGKALCEGNDARCFKCRVLLLICDDCRKVVRTWGDKREESKVLLHPIYCGDDGLTCLDDSP
jgi:predicted sulfurtransferase